MSIYAKVQIIKGKKTKEKCIHKNQKKRTNMCTYFLKRRKDDRGQKFKFSRIYKEIF